MISCGFLFHGQIDEESEADRLPGKSGQLLTMKTYAGMSEGGQPYRHPWTLNLSGALVFTKI
jgi:hypothetical protein